MRSFYFSSSRLDILPAGGRVFSLPLVAFEKLRVRVTRLQRATRRWPDTGKGIPGHWSRRRLSDVLSFVDVCVCVTGALYSTAIEPPRGPLPRSPPLPRAISHCAQGVEAISPFLRCCLSSRVLVSSETSKPPSQ